MQAETQMERAERFRAMHHAKSMLLLPNVWDAASARVIEQAGFPALATTSSGIATSLGYSDGQRMTRAQMIEAIARMTRVATAPVTADIEAGYGDSIPEIVETIRQVIATGAVGVNIEDSSPASAGGMIDAGYQCELIAALRALATSLDIPFVINARVDVYLREAGAAEERFAETVRRANAYLRAGADCAYPIGGLDMTTIGELVRAIEGPINIMGGPHQPPLADLERAGVARVSLAGQLMRAVLGSLRAMARDLIERGDYSRMVADSLSSADISALYPD